MSTAVSRTFLRHTRLVTRRIALRHASTTSQAAEAVSSTATKAKDSASNVTSKASQGLSRVTSSAGPALSGAAQRVSRVLGNIGGRTGRMIKFIESMIPPTIYYSRVGLELSKLIFQGQKMSPPNIAAFQSHLQPLFNAVRHPANVFTVNSQSSLTPEHLLSRIRNINRQQMISGGVIVAEVLGFFTVGEMLGRLKLVGYRGDREHHETATPHEALD